jgi:hypothetical protein
VIDGSDDLASWCRCHKTVDMLTISFTRNNAAYNGKIEQEVAEAENTSETLRCTGVEGT